MIIRGSYAHGYLVIQVVEVKLSETRVRSYLVCPECGFPMVLFTSREARYHSGEKRKYYRCANVKECDIVCGAHPDGTPLGIPGNQETRSARKELHKVFDQFWLGGRWSREEAYIILQILTGLGEEEAHIARFDQVQCEVTKGKIEEFLKLNPLQDQVVQGVRVPIQEGFVYMKRECIEHGFGVHRVYLESRQEFCVNCLGKMRGPVWRNFLVFKRNGYSK